MPGNRSESCRHSRHAGYKPDAPPSQRYGLTYEDIVAVNPKIIYLVLTDYGMEGPERNRSGFEYAAFWARSGIIATLGEQGSPPVQQRPGFGDQTISLAIAAAIGTALFEWERSGKGQQIDCALLHTALWANVADVVASLKDRAAMPRNDRTQTANPLFNFYETKGGKWVQLVMIQSDRFWGGLLPGAGRGTPDRRPSFRQPHGKDRKQHGLASINHRPVYGANAGRVGVGTREGASRRRFRPLMRSSAIHR